MSSRITRGRKFDAVLAGARDIFLRDGYEGASVDDIARAAAVSKATLYKYFPDKRLLFLEVARTEIAAITQQAKHDINRAHPPAEVLETVGRTILGFNASPVGLGIYRLCVAEAERFPDLAKAFYEAGPLAGRAALSGYLQEACGRGDLSIPDCDLAAEQFVELCRAGVHLRLLLGVTEHVAPHEMDRVIASAIELFLARYGAKAT